VRNALAIANKEFRSYFASPIAYILIGLFSLLFGYFFYVFLMVFVRQSEQMMQFGGGGGANVNQMMIRGLFQNTAVIILFVMPMITMRTYSEEKRSGTIELLLTSPLSDLEIVFGKFFGALGLYVAMLLVTLAYIAILFVYGTESDFMKSVRGHRAQLFPNATIVPIEGAGHHIPHEKPVELAEIVVPFLLQD